MHDNHILMSDGHEKEMINHNDSTVRFKSATIEFGGGLTIDGYQFPDGSFGVSMSGASRLLGYQDNWLSRLTSRSGKSLKVLQGMGFTGYQQIGLVTREGKRGASEVHCISLDDFVGAMLYATSQGKKEAVALNRAFTKQSLTDYFRDAFGERPLTLEEKRDQFYKDYAKSISEQEWAEGNGVGVYHEPKTQQTKMLLSGQWVPTALYKGWDLEAIETEYFTQDITTL